MSSLKKQLKHRLLLYMAAVMLVLLVVMNIAMQKLVSDYVLTRLQHDADSLISVLNYDPQQKWQIDPRHLSTVYDRVRSGHYYVVRVGDQWLRSRSLFDLETPGLSNDVDRAGNSLLSNAMSGPGDEYWLVYEHRFEKNQQSIHLWIAEDVQPLSQQLHRYLLFTVLLIAILAMILIYGQSRLLNHTFKVFDRLREHIKTVRSQASMFEQHQVPDEISPLVTEIDRLVEHQHKRIQRTRNAISNLAHEIKRPLLILSLKTEQNREESQAVSQIQLIIDRELKRAKISGVSLSNEYFNHEEDISIMLDMMERLYPQVSISIDRNNEIPAIWLDRADMLELFGNLLDNACKFAQHKVQVKLDSNDEDLTLVIEDDGKGVSTESLDKITQRGFRLDESKSGHGLGLTICADIVEIYEGSLDFDNASVGGLKVTAKLPINR